MFFGNNLKNENEFKRKFLQTTTSVAISVSYESLLFRFDRTKPHVQGKVGWQLGNLSLEMEVLGNNVHPCSCI